MNRARTTEAGTNGGGRQQIHTRTYVQTSREETWRPGKTNRTLVPRGEKATASIMDIFIIGAASRRDLVRLWRSRRHRRRRPGLAGAGPIDPTDPPRDINIDENDAFIRERQVYPRLKSRKIYRDAASRRQPFPSGSYIKSSPDRFPRSSFGLIL